MPTRANSFYLYISVILVVASTLLLWGRGSFDIYEWDEARNGVNAYYMHFNHDYINLYYGNDPDTITSKPPLLIWLMVLSQYIFGFNEFAIRFPTLIATLLFLVVLYKLVKLYETPFKAFLTCMVLITCRAVISWHVGLTGDFDALLLLFLTLSVYYLSIFLEREKVYGLYLSAIFTGLAFYSKGTPAFLYIPGILIYLIISRRFKSVLFNRHTYFALITFLLIIGSWIFLATSYTAYPDAEDTAYGSRNSIETMLIHETFNRITDKKFNAHKNNDPFFFIHTIEWRMNVWHILFYITTAIGLFHMYTKRGHVLAIIRAPENRLTLMGLCLSIPIILLVNFSANPLNWYFTPVWAFIAFIVVRGIVYISGKWKPAVYVFLLVFAFNLVKHFLFIDKQPTIMHDNLVESGFFKKEEPIVLFSKPKDDLLLYVSWLGNGFVRYDLEQDKAKFSGLRGIIQQENIHTIEEQVSVESCFNSYCLVTITEY